MTPAEVLAKVLESGGRVVADPDRPRLLVPPALKSLVVEHREALRELVRRRQFGPPPTPVPALREALRHWYSLMAREVDENPPTPEEVRRLDSEIRRLWDDTGPAFAEAVHRQEAWTYYQETQRCPTCGKPGEYHDPMIEGRTE